MKTKRRELAIWRWVLALGLSLGLLYSAGGVLAGTTDLQPIDSHYKVTATVTPLGGNLWQYCYDVTNVDQGDVWYQGLDAFFIQVPINANITSITIPPAYYDSWGYWGQGFGAGNQYFQPPINVKSGYKWLYWFGYQPPSVYPLGSTAHFSFIADAPPGENDGLAVTYWSGNNPDYTAYQGSMTGPVIPETASWIQLNPTPDPIYGSPSPRNAHTAVYSPNTNRMIIFGGIAWYAGPWDDVWVLTNADGTGGSPAWIKLNPLTPNGAPAPRYWPVSFYDQANNRMIMHGGHTRPGYNEGHVGDTWILTNADGTGGAPVWIQLTTTGPAPARREQKGAYDAANNRLILGGGHDGYNNYDDICMLTNANGLGSETPAWTDFYPPGSLSVQGFQARAAGYDPASNTFIELALYEIYQPLRTLNLNGTPAWTDLILSGDPLSLRGGDTGVYDPGRNRMATFGGDLRVSPGGRLNEVWILDRANGQAGPAQWTHLNPQGTLPPARSNHSAVYNSATDRMTIFAGYDNNEVSFADVWVLTNAMGSAPNAPPVANAGGSRSILSQDQGTTVLAGTASDPDNDPLTFRWLEGQTVLADWQPVVAARPSTWGLFHSSPWASTP